MPHLEYLTSAYRPYIIDMTDPISTACCRQVSLSSPENSSSDSSTGRESSNGNRSPGNGRKKQKRSCGVCGDRAKSLHFGGLSCDSCKAFFRRSVQNDAFKNFQCPYDGKCIISISSRKSCQQCRFQKCISIGMEKSWVMTEKERQQMLKARLERKQRMDVEEEERLKKLGKKRGPTNYEPSRPDLIKYLTVQEQDVIEKIVQKYAEAYLYISRNTPPMVENEKSKNVELIGVFTSIIQRIVYFVRLLPEFTSLSTVDQSILLKEGMLEICLIRSAFAFDVRNNTWPGATGILFRDTSTVNAADLRRMVSKELYEKHMKFIHGVKALNPDQPTVMLLLLVVLFNPEREGLQDEARIATFQDRFLQIMRKYMDWKYHPDNATVLFPKLLMKLTDLRELNDSHIAYNINIEQKDIQQIQHELGKLDIGFYTSWSAVTNNESPDVHLQAGNSQSMCNQSDIHVSEYSVQERPPQPTSSHSPPMKVADSSPKNNEFSEGSGSPGKHKVGYLHDEPRGEVNQGSIHFGINTSTVHPYEHQDGLSSYLGYTLSPSYFPSQPLSGHPSAFPVHGSISSEDHRPDVAQDSDFHTVQNLSSSVTGYHRIQHSRTEQGFMWYGMETEHDSHLSHYSSHHPDIHIPYDIPPATASSSNAYNQYYSPNSSHGSYPKEFIGQRTQRDSGVAELNLEPYRSILNSTGNDQQLDSIDQVMTPSVPPHFQQKINSPNNVEYSINSLISDLQGHSNFKVTTEGNSEGVDSHNCRINQSDQDTSHDSKNVASCVERSQPISRAYGTISTSELGSSLQYNYDCS